MKKYTVVALVLILLLSFAFSGCGILGDYLINKNTPDETTVDTQKDPYNDSNDIDKEDSTSVFVRITEVGEGYIYAELDSDNTQVYKFITDTPVVYSEGKTVLVKYTDLRKENIDGKDVWVAQLLSIQDPDMIAAAKPVIYLYPTEKTDVSVIMDLNGDFTCTYPQYKNGWRVTAYPDGRLVDDNGQVYNYLYWEADLDISSDFAQGFCVKGEDTAEFLEDSLEKLGLNRREANEFIVYWLPMMQDNPYNIISFSTESYIDAAKMNVQPQPDTMIRVFMTWKGVKHHIQLEPQRLDETKRNGFTVVEWGGSEILD